MDNENLVQEMEMEATPIEGTDYVLLQEVTESKYVKGSKRKYPFGMFHVDSFYHAYEDNRYLFEALIDKKVKKVKLRVFFEIVEEE